MYIFESVQFLKNQITKNDDDNIDSQKLIINFMSKYDYAVTSALTFDNEFRIRELESSIVESSHEDERLHVDVIEDELSADCINV